MKRLLGRDTRIRQTPAKCRWKLRSRIRQQDAAIGHRKQYNQLLGRTGIKAICYEHTVNLVIFLFREAPENRNDL